MSRIPLDRIGLRRAEGPPDPAALEERVRECFQPVQAAWANRDGDALARYVTPSLRAEMEREFDELEAAYRANRLDDLQLRDVRLLAPPGAEDQAFDAEVSFEAREWVEDLRTGRPVEGEPRSPQRFDQRWRFVRGKGGSWVIDEVAPAD
jgi:predicted lipid-binding transport protein (Tim44 family)